MVGATVSHYGIVERLGGGDILPRRAGGRIVLRARAAWTQYRQQFA
jgi:hypothetical protein